MRGSQPVELYAFYIVNVDLMVQQAAGATIGGNSQCDDVVRWMSNRPYCHCQPTEVIAPRVASNLEVVRYSETRPFFGVLLLYCTLES